MKHHSDVLTVHSPSYSLALFFISSNTFNPVEFPSLAIHIQRKCHSTAAFVLSRPWQVIFYFDQTVNLADLHSF